ncbi:hypothetical protein LINGRAHAP2_LOCUS7480 [Linum grandiflorum]
MELPEMMVAAICGNGGDDGADLQSGDAGGFIIGRRSGGRNRRGYTSDDFRYDQESYSLNFEEDGANREGELPFSSFAARLPTTPPSFVNLNLHLN